MKSAGFIGLIVLLGATAAQADLRDDALSAVLHCSSMGDKAQRLVCYDSAAVRVPGALKAPPAPITNAPAQVAGAIAAPPPVVHRQRSSGFIASLFGPDGPNRPPQTTPAQFGSESIANGGKQAYPIPMDGDTIDAITARMVSYDVGGGYMTVTLDNGQVWHQVSGEPVGHLARPAASYVVTIERGGAGAYDMKLSHFARTLAVRRLR
ncbi:MAG TPA: hypothetical protein VK515_03450 [Rhizomicrobium sp.]|nr:hypothetical protein [Rhizomicrobium sp.]